MLGFTPFAAASFADIQLNHGEINVQVVGVQSTGEIGTVTFITNQNFAVTGVQGTGQVGNVVVDAKATVYLIGVQATGYIGYPTVWGLVNDAQTATWTPVNDTQSTVWTKIAA